MTEDDARHWLTDHVSRETFALFDRLVGLVQDEAAAQNLVAHSTIDQIWSRHVADSAQILSLLTAGTLMDIGSGAGFPGLVISIMRSDPVVLIEPRRLRADFLSRAATVLELDHVSVLQKRVEAIAPAPCATLVARAVAPLASLFAMAEHLADDATRWVLPKGRAAQSELAAARETWHGDFQLVNSVTDPQATIVVATRVRRRAKRGQGR